jgi:hypothetical protein
MQSVRRWAAMGLAALCLVSALCLAGCTSEQLSSAVVKPAKYAHYTCHEIETTGAVEAARERELKALIEKAEQGAGGKFAATVAYRSEYLSVQGKLRELEAAAVDKNCKMAWRTASEQAVQ